MVGKVQHKTSKFLPLCYTMLDVANFKFIKFNIYSINGVIEIVGSK
jgi:hypothetical protein